MKFRLPYKRKQLDYILSSCWYKEVITDPRQTFAEAFLFMDIFGFRRLFKEVLRATLPGASYTPNLIADLICEFKIIESVINAAYIINRDQVKCSIETDSTELSNNFVYYGEHYDSLEWDYFPRSLSRSEFMDPYLIFDRFFEYRSLKQWKAYLLETMETATVKEKGGSGLDLIEIYFQLTKLFEAACLVDIRENKHDHGMLKSSFS